MADRPERAALSAGPHRDRRAVTVTGGQRPSRDVTDRGARRTLSLKSSSSPAPQLFKNSSDVYRAQYLEEHEIFVIQSSPYRDLNKPGMSQFRLT